GNISGSAALDHARTQQQRQQIVLLLIELFRLRLGEREEARQRRSRIVVGVVVGVGVWNGERHLRLRQHSIRRHAALLDERRQAVHGATLLGQGREIDQDDAGVLGEAIGSGAAVTGAVDFRQTSIGNARCRRRLWQQRLLLSRRQLPQD